MSPNFLKFSLVIGFGQWYYRKDPTHVAFYRPKTFEVIASIMNWTYEIPEKDVVIFKK